MIILLQFLPGSTSLGATVMLYWTKMILEANELENCHCVQWEGKRRGKRERGCIVCKTVTVIVTGDESRHEQIPIPSFSW